MIIEIILNVIFLSTIAFLMGISFVVGAAVGTWILCVTAFIIGFIQLLISLDRFYEQRKREEVADENN